MRGSIETACPECGHDGPHPIVSVEDGATTVECINLCGEFVAEGNGHGWE